MGRCGVSGEPLGLSALGNGAGMLGRGWEQLDIGCMGHTELEARGPDVARAARRMWGPKHPLHTGWQIPSETQRNFPKKMGGVGKTPNLLQSSV